MKNLSAIETLNDFVKRGVRFSFNPDYNGKNDMFVLSSKWRPLKKNQDYKSSMPQNGIYIMFEKGELLDNGQDRIIRIGINKEDNRLPQRIKNHYVGTMRRSVFRKHIGSCFDNGKRTPEQIEKLVSKYIQENISFVVFEIKDKAQRLDLESKLIGLVAQSGEKPSKNWLGKKCQSPEISKGNIWNKQHLKSKPATIEELNDIAFNLILSGDLK